MMVALLFMILIVASSPQTVRGETAFCAPCGDQKTVSSPATKRNEESSADKPVVTRHSGTINGKKVIYTATTGLMPISGASGEAEATMFFTAYTAENMGKAADRPLLFAFNGGPGSSSVWLHLGALGPKRVVLEETGKMPPPPYRLTDNNESWLDQGDLVFIDPVGTGYSRLQKQDQAGKYFSFKGDIDSIGEFIRLYLSRYERWGSPLFLVGESYGTTRAAGLAGDLFERGIAFNGIILISSILNFSTISFTPGNDLPYMLFLPSYAAAAWYQGKLPPDLQSDVATATKEASQWAETGYLTALAKGDRLTTDERREVIKRLARYTGLGEQFIGNNNLRVEASHFMKELLRDRKQVAGRFDGRITGPSLYPGGEDPEFDPSLTDIRPPFSATLNAYMRSDLGYVNDNEYYILGGGIGPWNWGAQNSFTETAESLRRSMTKNPHMKIFVASGYFDLATPYFGTEYTLSHMDLHQDLRRNITAAYYEAGHMMYTDSRARHKLKKDITRFIGDALPR